MPHNPSTRSELMKFSYSFFLFLAFCLGNLCLPSRPAVAEDDCSTISTPTSTRKAVGFGFAVYSDLVSGSVPIASSSLCLDESGDVVQSDVPKICSFTESNGSDLYYDPDTDSLVAYISDLGFQTSDSSAAITFDVTTLESPTGTTFKVKSGDLSSVGKSRLVLGPGLPLLVAQANEGTIPFSVEFTNGSTAGQYRAVVVVSCTF